MQLVRFQKTNGTIAHGVLKDRVIHEINGSIYQTFQETGQTYPMGQVKLLIPCVPTNLYCVGLNFQEHIDELDLEVPQMPANFMKPINGICHPYEKIIFPNIVKRVDYEGEMALVIKDQIKDVPVEQALHHVLGVTPLNDVTEREMSYDYTQVTYSKSFDTFTSFGPVIDTDINPEDTVIRTYLNGEKVQEGYTKNFLFSCAHIVSYFSQGRTLFPGDIISTGTPSHVLAMKDGDTVEVEIEGIALRLVNDVYDPSRRKE
mgnify:CR=1 FL=1